MPQQSNRLYISDLGISQKTNKQTKTSVVEKCFQINV